MQALVCALHVGGIEGLGLRIEVDGEVVDGFLALADRDAAAVPRMVDEP
jgi:hypothetical protein